MEVGGKGVQDGESIRDIETGAVMNAVANERRQLPAHSSEHRL